MSSSDNKSRQSTHVLTELKTGAFSDINSRLLLWFICLFVVVFVVWAAGAEIDELARGEGKVIPSKQLQLVQNLEGGIVSEILISEGSRVEPGQVLIKIDDTLFESDYQESRFRVTELQVREARLRAEIGGDDEVQFAAELERKIPDLVKEERSLFKRRRAKLASSQSLIGQQLKQKAQALAQAKFNYQQALDERALAQKELEILKPLFAEGVVSEVELIRAEKAVLKAGGEASGNQFRIPLIEAEIAELRDKLAQQELSFKIEAQQALNEILAELPRLSQSGGALEDRVKRTQVRSPVKGTVKQLMVNTIGGVVQPGMDIVSVVPIEDALLIETRIRPADIARLYPGQSAMVKFTAYDFAIYGGLEAEVVHISADSISNDQGESFFLVRVRTQKNYLGDEKQPLPIIPGMIAQVDILTGKKTVLEYLLKPIFKARQVALTER